MALLVADSRSEKFEKPPPPKKKWIQNYLEARESENEDSQGSVASSSPDLADNSIPTDLKDAPTDALLVASATKEQQVKEAKGAIVQSVINQFQDYISQQTTRNHTNGISPQTDQECVVNAGKIAKMLDPKRGGDKFNDSLQRMKASKARVISKEAVTAAESPHLSQKDLGGVVQGVISQFLNGSMSDVNFYSRSSSRKRCRSGHEKCTHRSHRHRDSRGHGNHHHSHRHQQRDGGRGVTVSSDDLSEPHAKYARTSESSLFHHDQYVMDGGVLNLSLPKSYDMDDMTDAEAYNYITNSSPLDPEFEHQATRVTFASEDSCYSTLSLRSMEVSKSQQMYDADVALDLGIKKPSSTIAEVDDIRNQQNSYHTAFYPAQAVYRPQHGPTTGYIKPVPLSTLIVAPASLSPEVSPPVSPASSPGPVNLIVKPTITSFNPIEAPKQPTSKQMAVIQSPIVSRDYNHYQRSSPPVVSTVAAKSTKKHTDTSSSIQPKYSNHLSSQKQYSLQDIPKRTSHATASKASSSSKKPAPTKKDALPSAPVSSTPSASKRNSRKVSAAQDKSDVTNRATSPSTSSAVKAVAASTSTSSSTRELHNQLEKNRRAQLKLYFEEVASECQIDPKTKASNLTVIRTAYKVIMGLRRDERENERELAKLAQEKIKLTQRLEELKRQYPGVIREQSDE